MMRKSFWIIALLFTVMVAPTVRADITYTLDLGTGVSGTITTDGTIIDGTTPLSSTNIVGWNLTLTDGTNTIVLNQTSSYDYVSGVDLTASTTALMFNFDATDNGQLAFYTPIDGSDEVVCYTSNRYCGSDAISQNSIALNDLGGDSILLTEPESGTQIIATVTPEPASMLLFGTGLLGIIFVMRKRLFA